MREWLWRVAPLNNNLVPIPFHACRSWDFTPEARLPHFLKKSGTKSIWKTYGDHALLNQTGALAIGFFLALMCPFQIFKTTMPSLFLRLTVWEQMIYWGRKGNPHISIFPVILNISLTHLLFKNTRIFLSFCVFLWFAHSSFVVCKPVFPVQPLLGDHIFPGNGRVFLFLRRAQENTDIFLFRMCLLDREGGLTKNWDEPGDGNEVPSTGDEFKTGACISNFFIFQLFQLSTQ